MLVYINIVSILYLAHSYVVIIRSISSILSYLAVHKPLHGITRVSDPVYIEALQELLSYIHQI